MVLAFIPLRAIEEGGFEVWRETMKNRTKWIILGLLSLAIFVLGLKQNARSFPGERA
jgi:hypothetical protein